MMINPINCCLVCSNYRCLRVNECDGWWQSTGRTFLRTAAALTLTFLMWFLHSSRAALPLPEGGCVTARSHRRCEVQGGDQLLWNVKQKYKSRKWQGLLPPAAGVDPEPAVMTQIGPAFDLVFIFGLKGISSLKEPAWNNYLGLLALNGAENVLLSEVIKNEYNCCHSMMRHSCI